MSSRFNIILAAASLFLLASCGFTPMYGDNTVGNNSPVRGNIIIDPIAGHEGQLLKTSLEDDFNPQGIATTNAEYRLNINMSKVLIPAVVKSDGTIQRYNVRFTSNFQLFKTNDRLKPLLSGALQRSGSYNVAINANFASYEGEQDVIKRVLEEMAEDYVMRVTGYLASHAGEKPAPAPAPVTP